MLPLLDPRDRLSVIGVAFDVDGSLGSRGAALLEDYSDAPGERGHLLLSRDDLARRIALVTGDGLQPAVHAIGDRANRIVLDIYAELDSVWDGFRSLRPRIEHGQVVAPKDWPRFPKLGVVPSMQPARAGTDIAWVTERLGSDRSRGAYAWRRLAPELGKLAFGSDFPCDSPDPLRGLHAARTRHDGGEDEGYAPEQRLDGVAALAGYTIGAAYAAHQEDRRGRLIPGFACDMTVLDLDPVACEPEALLGGRVLMTVIDAEVAYRAHR
jgi:predicted amidohydrolase YtcJ